MVLTRNVSTLGNGSSTEAIQHGTVSLVVPMGEVETSSVHAGVHQLSQVLWAPRGGPDGANDLGAAFLGLRSGFHHVQIDETARQLNQS